MMGGNAKAIAAIAESLGMSALAANFSDISKQIQAELLDVLWDDNVSFFRCPSSSPLLPWCVCLTPLSHAPPFPFISVWKDNSPVHQGNTHFTCNDSAAPNPLFEINEGLVVGVDLEPVGESVPWESTADLSGIKGCPPLWESNKTVQGDYPPLGD